PSYALLRIIMSRIGKQPIQIPENVEVTADETEVKVSGSVGEVVIYLRPEIEVEVMDNVLTVKRGSPSRLARALHGTVRATIANAVEGVTKGHEKRLVLEGLGRNLTPDT
ncbi:MAG: 50S ribosomal protein L6, partial [Desulfobacterales bacterium]